MPRDVKPYSCQTRRRSSSYRWWLSLCSTVPWVVVSESPMTYYGGSILAMAGRNCVAIAVDKRFGVGNALVAVRHRPVWHFPDGTLVAMTGLERDVQSLSVELTAQVARTYRRGLGFAGLARKRQRSGHTAVSVSVKAIATLTSNILYSRKAAPYYVETLVVGLEPDTAYLENTTSINDRNETDHSNTTQETSEPAAQQQYRPYLCSMDVLGAMSTCSTFVCAGTALRSLYGTAQALYKPNLDADELLPLCAQAFLSALERNAMSGYGAMIYVLTPNGIIEYDVEGRSD